MIMAEVKTHDGDDFVVRLFNMSLVAFQNYANKRFVAIGRIAEISTSMMIDSICSHIGWK